MIQTLTESKEQLKAIAVDIALYILWRVLWVSPAFLAGLLVLWLIYSYGPRIVG